MILSTKAALAVSCLLSVTAFANGQDDDSVILQDTQLSYVIEPFEVIDPQWFHNSDLGGNVSRSDDALFGSQSVNLEIMESDSAEFGWILPTRSYNCFGAKHLSLWVKPLQVTKNGTTLTVTFFDDRSCLLTQKDSPDYVNTTCSDPDLLDEVIVMTREINQDAEGIWQEIQADTSLLEDMDLRHIRGWSIQIENSAQETKILIDQLSCVGGSNLLSAAFHIGAGLSYEDVVADGTWSSDFYQSPQSKDYSNPYFENGELHVDPYMVEQGQ